jgi:hypothetical protein
VGQVVVVLLTMLGRPSLEQQMKDLQAQPKVVLLRAAVAVRVKLVAQTAHLLVATVLHQALQGHQFFVLVVAVHRVALATVATAVADRALVLRLVVRELQTRAAVVAAELVNHRQMVVQAAKA